MERLLAQLKDLPARLKQDARARRLAMIAAAISVAAAIAATAVTTLSAPTYGYVHSDLDQEEIAEATRALRAGAIPFRVESGAVAVPDGLVYDARILLAAHGIPREHGSAAAVKRPLGGSARGFELANVSVVDSRRDVLSKDPSAPGEQARAGGLITTWLAICGGLALLLLVAAVPLVSRRSQGGDKRQVELLDAGGSVAELEAAFAYETATSEPMGYEAEPKAPTPEQALLEHARHITASDPMRAAHLLRAWLKADPSHDQSEPPNG